MRSFTQFKYIEIELKELNSLLHDMQLEGKNIVSVNVDGFNRHGLAIVQILYHLIDDKAVMIEEEESADSNVEEATQESNADLGISVSSE